MVNNAALARKTDTFRVIELPVLRLTEMDLQTGTIYKTYAHICQKQKVSFVVESSCGTCLRICESGTSLLTVSGEAVNDAMLTCTDHQAAPFVVVAGLATNTQHPALRLDSDQNNMLAKYQEALQSKVVHSPTFAKAILDFFSGKTQAVVCPVVELAQIDLLLIEALKTRFHISYTGMDTPVVVIHNGIMAAKSISS